jgi:P4 family phage/plasmid primase-like protien
MGKPKPPTNREVVNEFYSPETIVDIPFTDPLIQITPMLDLAFNDSDLSFYYYKDGSYHLLSDQNPKIGQTAQLLERFLNTYFPDFCPNSNKIIEIKESIIRATEHRFTTAKPNPYIALTDRTFNTDTFSFEDHNHEHFALLSLPFSSADLSTATPTFNAYLDFAFPEPEEKLLIWDMIAYYLVPNTREPAAFYLYGPPRTGKSRFMHMVQNIFPPQYTASFSLQSLTTTDYTVAELSQKFLNILDEDESSRIQSDKFKSLIDGNSMQARRLYQPPFTFAPYTKFLFSSNQLPNFKYVEGLERRLHFVHFQHPVPVERQDKELDGKLQLEIPGIVGKALIHAKAFRDRNEEFIFPETSIDLKHEFTNMVVPAFLFIKECCSILPKDSDDWVSNKELYEAYASWCVDSGHKSMARQNFHRQLLSHPEITSKTVHNERRKNIQIYDLANGWEAPPQPPPKYGR